MSVKNAEQNNEWVDNGPEFDGLTDQERAESLNDLHDEWKLVDDEDEPTGTDKVLVQFSVRGGETRGTIIKDTAAKPRAKIVFPTRRGWRGAPIKDGEELTVLVEHDTKPDEPRYGALIVQRDVPTVDVRRGGHHLPCAKCGTWTVPARSGPPPGTRPGQTYRSYGLREANCETCGLLHDLIWPPQ